MYNPTIYTGKCALDERGTLFFNNDFNMCELGIKRRYLVQNWDTIITRAFHSHRQESKYLEIITGSVLVCMYEVENWETGSAKGDNLTRIVLNDFGCQILKIPAGFAHGFRALKNDSKLLFYSDKTLAESKGDDVRFAWDLHGKEIWESKNY